jgi:hypothetical protein
MVGSGKTVDFTGTMLDAGYLMPDIQACAAFSTPLGGRSFAGAGMTGRTCEKEVFRCVSATAAAPDRHPGMLPEASEMKVKLIIFNVTCSSIANARRGKSYSLSKSEFPGVPRLELSSLQSVFFRRAAAVHTPSSLILRRLSVFLP